MIVGTAGHIDHGKTALVRALTGVDTDRLPEEKRRGITIELGFAPLVLPGLGTVGIVDVPGHEGFVRTMLAGATGVDVGLLVVAADEGVMPQTREHLAILSLLAVRAGVIALTKCDLADAEWLELVRDDVRALVAGTALEGAPVIATSATTGEGIDTLRTTLAETLRRLPARDAGDLFRLPVDRAFTVKGTGTVVTGTVWSGTIGADTPLRLYPLGKMVRVRALQSHGVTVDRIAPGERAAVALAGIDLADVSRGAILVQEAAWEPSHILRGDVSLLADADRPLRPRERVRLHLATTDVGARVVASGGEITPGERRGVRLILDEPIVARAGDRFVLRRASPLQTIGGGMVVDPAPPRRRARPWLPGEMPAADRLARLLHEAGEAGVAEAALPVRLGLRPGDVPPLLAGTHDVVRLGDRLFARERVEELAARIAAFVGVYHGEHPLEPVVPAAAVRAAFSAGDLLLQGAIAAAVASGALAAGGGGVRSPGWEPTLSSEAQGYIDWLRRRLAEAGIEPPSVAELRSERGGNDPVPYLRILERGGDVVQVEPERFYAAPALRDLVERLRAAMEPGQVYSPSALREMVGSSRKFLIPFLEYCDRQRITERRLDGRVRG